MFTAMLLPLLSFLATLARANPYAPCAHTPDQPGPRSTQATRLDARDQIRAEVSHLGGSERFANYLIIVAARESSLRPGVIHVGDAESSAAAYRRLRNKHIAAGHPLARRRDLWLTYGLFGQNSNYLRDYIADPRQLCTVPGAVTAYAAAGRRAIARMRGCVAQPTWADLHRALQRGKICPDGRGERIPALLGAVPLRAGDLG